MASSVAAPPTMARASARIRRLELAFAGKANSTMPWSALAKAEPRAGARRQFLRFRAGLRRVRPGRLRARRRRGRRERARLRRELPGGLAPLRIEPSAAAGSPTTGAHQVGEFFVDSAGDLLFCKVAASVPPPSGHRSRRQVGQARLKEVKGGVQLEQRAVNNHILCRARASGHPDSRL